ncbi:MAG: metallophosphoesterase [Victivallaceae bacterium]|nr:metallophosphoesterase [Victivallaceae bacterium]
MKIIHFSDPHAGGPAEDWMAYLDKRWVGVFNYCFRRRFIFNMERLQRAVSYILDAKPDVAVCTGDLTSAGQPGEFAKIIPILKPLRDSKIPVLFVPGNHDCYVTREKCVAAMREAVVWLTRGRYNFDDLPLALDLGECEFVMINTGYPSNLLCSWGFVKADSRDFLLRHGSAAKVKPRILVSHYPIIEDHPVWRWRHRLFGQEEIVRMLADGRLDLSLCGHVHFPYKKVNERGRGENCAGSVTRNGVFSEIEYDQNNDIFTFKEIHLA